MPDVKHGFHSELKKTSRLPPRDTIFGSLICRLVCIKTKSKCKLQSRKSVFRADIWTVCFEQVAVASLLIELARRKCVKHRL